MSDLISHSGNRPEPGTGRDLYHELIDILFLFISTVLC